MNRNYCDKDGMCTTEDHIEEHDCTFFVSCTIGCCDELPDDMKSCHYRKGVKSENVNGSKCTNADAIKDAK